MHQNGVSVVPWPALPPDTNCIEHLWDVLGRRNDKHVSRVQTKGDLIAALQHHVDDIQQQESCPLVFPMPRRLRECIAANDGHTRY